MTSLSDAHIAAIVFNETRSLSGTGIDTARTNIAHVIINALASTHRFPLMASTTARPGPGEAGTLADCQLAVAAARTNLKAGTDPTGGGEHFNFRKNNSQAAFQGHAIRTSVGPFSNSYPTTPLPASGIYANTYA